MICFELMNDTAPAGAPIRRPVLRKRGLPMRACSGSGCFLARLLACSPALGRGVKRPLGRGRTRRLALLVGRQAEISTESTLSTGGFSTDSRGAATAATNTKDVLLSFLKINL